MGQISVGLIGAGRWGRCVLGDLVSLGCQVVVVDPDDESRAAAMERGAFFATHELAALPHLDGVVVATPARAHAAVTRALLDRGVPVFVEKPLTTSVTDADDLVSRGEGRVFVMDKWRYHPGVRRLGELLREGAIGEIQGLRTIRVGPSTAHDVDCVWTLAPHDLSIALELLGEVPEPVVAIAPRSGSGVIGMLALLRTARGVWHHLEVSETALARCRRIELYGDAGQMLWSDARDEAVTVTRYTSSGLASSTVEARGELPLLAELRAFVQHLCGGPPPTSGVAEGRRVVEVIEALHRVAGAM